MIQTQYNQDMDYTITDSTVYVNQGVAQIGNSILPFRGDTITFSKMVDFGDRTNVYQYSALLLQNFNSYADLTSVVSIPADSTQNLLYPELIPDTTNAFAPVYPIGLFLFNNDGQSVNLISTQRVNC